MTDEEIFNAIDAVPLEKCELSNGETLAYRVFGEPGADKTSIVLVHGNASSHLCYAPLLVDPRMKDFHMIAVDTRGFGDSTYNKSIESHDDWADDYADFIQKLKLDKPIVVGHSTGGATVLALGLRHPELVSGVVMKASVALDGYRMIKLGADGKPDGLVKTREECIATAKMTQMPLANEDLDFQFGIWSYVFGTYAPPAKDSALFRRGLVEGAVKQRAACRLDTAVANSEFNATPLRTPRAEPSAALAGLRVPLHVAHGARDPICAYAQARAIVELVNAEALAPAPVSLHTFSGGHMPLYQCKDEFVELLLKVIAGIKSA